MNCFVPPVGEDPRAISRTLSIYVFESKFYAFIVSIYLCYYFLQNLLSLDTLDFP